MAEADFLADIEDGGEALLDELGGSVTYDQPPIAPFALTVIWTERTGEISAWCLLSDFPDLASGETAMPRKGDRITRSGHIYRVADVALDGTGGATLEVRLLGSA